MPEFEIRFISWNNGIIIFLFMEGGGGISNRCMILFTAYKHKCKLLYDIP